VRARGGTVWFTGLPAAGKTTLSAALERALLATGHPAYRLDGDELRRHLCDDLGFDRAARAENVRRVAHVARLLADAGSIVLVALVSPYAEDRGRARELHAEIGLPFLEVFLDTPLGICRQRDPKGLYARALRGELSGLTGVDDPYEPPPSPELRLTPEPLERSVQRVLEALSAAELT
jgi:bifunctional enzyme CysN/CysC